MKLMNKGLLAGAVLLVLAGGYWGYTQFNTVATDEPTGLLPYKNAKVIDLGQQIYAANCAACHGDNLEGEADWQQPKPSGRMPAPPHDETGHTWHHSDELLFKLTKYGIARLSNNPAYQTDMPVYEEVLTDDEIIAVLAYIKSTWPAKVQGRHDQINTGR
ncbi:c-type cytochrome [Maritalea mediterranea]|uniref:Cytochrome c n=1 Tax=Maritalea mediterranea TaxID=2909667 RepID=A0ABS9E579_9HYPH|nr:cytochrome c [Maritalea mediterranea]MCF4097372.1 cytochrome c [Maritalea mediterranea]